VMQLRHARAGCGTHYAAAHHWKIFELADVFNSRAVRGVECEIPIVDRFCFTTVVFLDVSTANDPLTSQWRQSFPHVAMNGGVSPGSTRVVNTNGGICGQRAVKIARRILCYFTKWHFYTGQFAVD